MPIELTENFRALFYATQTLGFYAHEDVEINLIKFAAPRVAASDLLNGTIDLSWVRRRRFYVERIADQSRRPQDTLRP